MSDSSNSPADRPGGDTSDLAALEAASDARLAAIVESSDDAIIGKTLDGIVVSWNHGAERIFGYTAEEMIGQPIARLVPDDRRDDLPGILSAVRRGDRIGHFETERIRKDGERVHVSLTVSPIRDATGRIVGASKIARDVTERRRSEREREELLRATEQARALAESADRAQVQLLAMLAHELRNPLAAVRSAIATAQLGPAQRDHALDIAQRQAGNLGRLIDDLLDVARFTRGQISLKRERVSVAAVVARAVETTRPLLTEMGHELTIDVEHGLAVDADCARLAQVIENLLGNAAKYTPAGGRITVRAERRDGEAVLSVTDSGIGIDASMLPRVFDLFAQAERGLDRTQGGLGIGLTVVRRIVELHGGHVGVRSEGIGMGAEFVVRLEALPPDVVCVDADAPRVAGDAPVQQGAHILLVEDNVDAAESLKMLLELHGHRVAVAYDGETAIAAAESDVPDMMLIDIGLPKLDGYEVVRRLRLSETLRDGFLVALTGYGRDEDRERSLEAGFDRHLVKPADPDDINALARLSLERRGR